MSKNKNINVKIKPETFEILVGMAEKEEITLSQFMRQMIKLYLESLSKRKLKQD